MNTAAMPQAITSPWTTSAEASSWRPDPMARATADATAPPMLELATCCMSISNGNTSDNPASALGSSWPTKYALMLDPLTAAVCSPDEIDRLFEEMWSAERESLTAFD